MKKMYSKWVFSSLVMLTATPLLSAQAFVDTTGHWANAAIQRFADLGAVSGFDGYFRPNDSITRGEFAVILDQLLHFTIVSDGSFSDVADHFYTDAILKSNQAGILVGDGDLLRPNDPLSRQEAVSLLSRAFCLNEESTETSFQDQNSIASWAQGAVAAMTSIGAIHGYDGYFRPADPITRGEISSILNEFMPNILSNSGTYQDAVPGNVLINVPNVVLENTSISGNVVFSEGTQSGSSVMSHVNVSGNTLVRGGGTMIIKNQSQLPSLTISGPGASTSLQVDADSTVSSLLVDNGVPSLQLSGPFESIALQDCGQIKLQNAQVHSLEIEKPSTSVSFDKDSQVNRLTIAPSASGSSIEVIGDVESISINSPNVSLSISGNVNHLAVLPTATSAAIQVKEPGFVQTGTINAENVSITGDGLIASLAQASDTDIRMTEPQKQDADNLTNPIKNSQSNSSSGSGGSGSSGGSGDNGDASSQPSKKAGITQIFAVPIYSGEDITLSTSIYTYKLDSFLSALQPDSDLDNNFYVGDEIHISLYDSSGREKETSQAIQIQNNKMIPSFSSLLDPGAYQLKVQLCKNEAGGYDFEKTQSITIRSRQEEVSGSLAAGKSILAAFQASLGNSPISKPVALPKGSGSMSITWEEQEDGNGWIQDGTYIPDRLDDKAEQISLNAVILHKLGDQLLAPSDDSNVVPITFTTSALTEEEKTSRNLASAAFYDLAKKDKPDEVIELLEDTDFTTALQLNMKAWKALPKELSANSPKRVVADSLCQQLKDAQFTLEEQASREGAKWIGHCLNLAIEQGQNATVLQSFLSKYQSILTQTRWSLTDEPVISKIETEYHQAEFTAAQQSQLAEALNLDGSMEDHFLAIHKSFDQQKGTASGNNYYQSYRDLLLTNPQDITEETAADIFDQLESARSQYHELLQNEADAFLESAKSAIQDRLLTDGITLDLEEQITAIQNGAGSFLSARWLEAAADAFMDVKYIYISSDAEDIEAAIISSVINKLREFSVPISDGTSPGILVELISYSPSNGRLYISFSTPFAEAAPEDQLALKLKFV